MAAMIMATSCSKDDENNVPDNGRDDVQIVSTQIPFSIRVTNSNSLTKKMNYTEETDGTISIAFAPDGTDTKLKVLYGTTELGNLDLVSDGADGYEFSGTLTLTEGVTVQSLSDGSINLNYEYGTALEAPASSTESLLDLVQNCGHLYKGSAKSNAEAITLTDQNTYLAISMSPFTDHAIKINGNDFTVEKQNDGRLWVAVPSGAAVESEELGLKQQAEDVKPSQYHKVARQYFTVADGKKVYFSPGNLQATYNGTKWAWGFAPSQTTIIGKAAANTKINGNGTVSENGTVDFFGWVGESSEWTGEAIYGISNSTSTNSVDGYGTGKNEALKSDWGKVFGEDSPWYTLSHEEWVYLLGNGSDPSRSGASNLCHCASVNSVNGLIILPDDYDTEGLDWSSIDWAALESAGAVFLPAAGYRVGTGVIGVGSGGVYWSSSAHDENRAWDLCFYSDRVKPGYYYDRHVGQTVRLVRPL